MKSLLVRTRTAELAVYEWGERGAPAVLYWDGLGGSGLHANELAPILAAEHGLRVVAPDPPGHGRSPALPPDVYRPSALAALAAELLATLGIAEAMFVGFSWGAEVAVPFGARYPEQATRLVLVDGGYWDFADLSGFDVHAGLDARVEAARRRAADDEYAGWDAYIAAQRDALGRWGPALEEAHRATMRERDGRIVPVTTPETIGAIHHGNCLEPTAGELAGLRAAGIPVLLLTPADGVGAVGGAGIERLRANVPRLRHAELPGAVHDLVSRAPRQVAELIGRGPGATT